MFPYFDGVNGFSTSRALTGLWTGMKTLSSTTIGFTFLSVIGWYCWLLILITTFGEDFKFGTSLFLKTGLCYYGITDKGMYVLFPILIVLILVSSGVWIVF